MKFRYKPLKRSRHFVEWTSATTDHEGEAFEAWWRMLDAVDFSIHYHVFTPTTLSEFLHETRRRLGLSFEIREFEELHEETLFVLENTG